MVNLVSKPLLLFAIIILIYCLAIPVDILEIDSAQYATIAQEMILRNDYIHVFDRGAEYLDKPPFIFWISAAFYHLFGMGNLAFKLPSILFSCLGIYATYKLSRIYYSKETSFIAALILATTQGYFHFNNDVRTDTYLTNSIIAAVWLISEFLRNDKWLYIIAGFIIIGIGMLSKGPLGIIIPAIAIGGHLVMKKDWKSILKWEWIIGIVVVLIVLSPMLLGLYEQFDLHPEKVVNQKTGVSGLRFFFWEQSFGRITGENVWKNDTGPFFFFPNIAWSFMPWTIPLFYAVIQELYDAITIRSYLKNKKEWISIFGLVIPFIALSQSHYKLPHYIYVVFPFASILTANFLSQIQVPSYQNKLKIINCFQSVVLSLVWVLAGTIFLWFFPLKNWILIITSILGFLGFTYVVYKEKKDQLKYFLSISLITVLSVNVLLACQFYPSILKYQAGGQLANEILSKGINPNEVFIYRLSARSVDVKTHSIIYDRPLTFFIEKMNANQSIYVVTDYQGILDFTAQGYQIKVISEKPNHQATLITINFLVPSSREKSLNSNYLIMISKTKK